MDRKILFIRGAEKANKFHGLMAKAINADEFSTNFNILPFPENAGKLRYNSRIYKSIRVLKSALTLPQHYDIYLSETVFVIPVLAKLFGRIPRDSLIINISADPLLYNLTHLKKLSFFDNVQRVLLRYVDGFILVGNWKFLLRKLGNRRPCVEIVAGVSTSTYYSLLDLNINKPEKHNIIFVGTVTPDRIEYKGVDILLKAFKIVKKEFPDAKLYLTGYSQITESTDIIYSGWKKGKDFTKIFENMSIAVNVGRGDTFPVGTIEAMLAGVPAIVSKATGTKIIVQSVDKDFVVNLNAEEVAHRIITYFNMPYKRKIILRQRFRDAAKQYKSSEAIRVFKLRWDDLLKQILLKKI